MEVGRYRELSGETTSHRECCRSKISGQVRSGEQSFRQRPTTITDIQASLPLQCKSWRGKTENKTFNWRDHGYQLPIDRCTQDMRMRTRRTTGHSGPNCLLFFWSISQTTIVGRGIRLLSCWTLIYYCVIVQYDDLTDLCIRVMEKNVDAVNLMKGLFG